MQSGSARSGSYILKSPENILAGNPPLEFAALADTFRDDPDPRRWATLHEEGWQLAKCANVNPTLFAPRCVLNLRPDQAPDWRTGPVMLSQRFPKNVCLAASGVSQPICEL